MTKAAELAKMGEVITNSQIGGRRNLIINGAMQIFQRGTSFSGTNAYNADRWLVDDNQDGGGQSTDAPNDFNFSLKINPTSGQNAGLRQAIELPSAGEGGIFRSGQKFTLSFYLKSDNAGEAINIFIASGTTVTATTTSQVNDTSTGLTTTTSWARYTYTFSSNNVGGSDTCYNIVPYVTTPSGAVYWTGVQLELGNQATPFEHRSFAEELALSQRFYHFSGFPKIIPGQDQSDGSLVDYEGQIFSWTLGGSNRHATSYSFPVKMRSNPAIVMYGPIDGTSARSAPYNSATQETVSAYYNESPNGLHGYFTCGSNTTGQRFFLSADIEF